MKPLACLIFAVASVGAAELPVVFESVVINGKQYQNAYISTEGKLAVIRHDSGLSRIPLTHLPPDVLEKVRPTPQEIITATTKEVLMRDIPLLEVQFQHIYHAVLKLETEGMDDKPITVVQTIGMGQLLATVGFDENPVLVIGDPTERADGDVFRAILRDTGRFFGYVSVLGAKKRVKILSVHRSMTPQEMIAKLKDGATYKVAIGEAEVTCRTCKGANTECPDCDAAGKIKIPQMFLVKW